MRVFDQTDCREPEKNESYEGKFVIISPDYFQKEYKEAKNQLFLALGGIGCDASAIGSPVFGRDFETAYKQDRDNILGFASDDALQEWQDLYGMSLDMFTSVE